uniref:CSON001457 protein n=1 Tax=Culicoides sonorensis TaxID=179676 RepID=A0A336LQW0_CULSO
MPKTRKTNSMVKNHLQITVHQITFLRAQAIYSEVSELLSADVKFTLKLNPNGKPAKGSFEIFIQKSPSSDRILIWSGLNKGPPRKDKFPEAASLIESISKNIN